MGIKFQILKFQTFQPAFQRCSIAHLSTTWTSPAPSERSRCSTTAPFTVNTWEKNIHSKVKANRYLIHKVLYTRWTWLLPEPPSSRRLRPRKCLTWVATIKIAMYSAKLFIHMIDDVDDEDLSFVLAALGPTRSSARSDVWTRPLT